MLLIIKMGIILVEYYRALVKNMPDSCKHLAHHLVHSN